MKRFVSSSEDAVRLFLIGALAISVGVGEALSQTAAPPSAAPAPAPPTAAPAAPPSGAPTLSPAPGATSPTGVAVPPTPSTNSTPSQSNVDLHPPSRLTNPGGPAGSSASGQVAPAAIPPQGQAPQGSGRPQPGGANTAAPAKAPQKTGASYSLAECMKLWDAKTHMTQGQWRAACARVQNRLNNLQVTDEATATKTPGKKRQSEVGGDPRTAN